MAVDLQVGLDLVSIRCDSVSMKLKSLLVMAFSAGVVLVLNGALAGAAAIHSLNDIPGVWTGVAGDLFSSANARLEYGRATEVGRKVNPSFTFIDYDLQGALEIGDRKLQITGAKLWLNAGVSDRAEIFWQINDPLVSSLTTVVRYVAESRSFELFESVEGRRNERRFVLQAAAKR